MFSEIRQKVARIDDQISDLKTTILAEMAVSGENTTLFKIINVCAVIQSEINSIKNDIVDSEVEEEETIREEWEEEQRKIEKEYYEGEKDNV